MKRILLIVSGGIAAYKSLELIRLLKERAIAVRVILTQGGIQFVTPLSLAALSEDKVYTDLWSLTDEAEMGHIQLSRSADLVVVAPASANILAKLAAGISDDLASTALLATDKQVLVAPAMNVKMWEHAATKANLKTLIERGIKIVGPDEGAMACGEYGFGRMAEPIGIADSIATLLNTSKDLDGLSALVTSGPTHEPIDPVRYLGNRSSGRQGHAIATALAKRGASVTLISGPTALSDPMGVKVRKIQTANEMLTAVEAALPVDIAICAAAVADWRADITAHHKLKKGDDNPTLNLVENPDILAWIAHCNQRPKLVVGFAAETNNLLEAALEKRLRKGCDWIMANPIDEAGSVFGSVDNRVHLVRAEGIEDWPLQTKDAVAHRLADTIALYFGRKTND